MLRPAACMGFQLVLAQDPMQHNHTERSKALEVLKGAPRADMLRFMHSPRIATAPRAGALQTPSSA